ncbi:NAD-dependent protein deacetylase [Cellulomonas carbonis]|uniref:NAD-dependent protein deacetylase n=1 Tax=Cellulomonas carbonis T26 TaxID=947969 RepID=A0A0A0BSJ1_9CELL|nr:NAD-dependent deacetylase [Cellulomonas carbonis T26]GGC07209.1 NAD-dependent protein deacetylase [Cellulomonas carbonis]
MTLVTGPPQGPATSRIGTYRDPVTAPSSRPPAAPPTVTPRTITPRFDPPSTPALELDEGLPAAVELLRGRRVAVITGAGVSTDSGIPDYRGPDSPPRRPMTYQQFVSDPDFRRTYWARNHVGWRYVHRTQPNAGHRALARLEHAGVVVGVVTQNVDRLHHLAGSRRVIDLHGTYADVVCLDCGHRVTRDTLAQRLEALNPGFVEAVGAVADVEIAPDADAVIESTQGFVVADCDVCGGMLKPEIVYFGESVPRERVDRAFALVDDADALLVAGSSLAVMSGFRFVRHVARSGRPVVVVNRGATRGDALATLRVHAGTSETLTALADALAPA